ncbi:hypothetical protein [Nocardia sp. MW-W600-9]
MELHKLDFELKKLMIEIRRRAAGFTDTLHHSDERTGAGQAAAAQFAAADATRDLPRTPKPRPKPTKNGSSTTPAWTSKASCPTTVRICPIAGLKA